MLLSFLSVNPCRFHYSSDLFKKTSPRDLLYNHPKTGRNISMRQTRRDMSELPSREALEPKREILTDEAIKAFGKRLREGEFENQIAKNVGCPYVRYTGIAFPRCEYTDECPEGIPVEYQKYLYNAQYVIVDVSPESMIKPIHWGGEFKRICVVYEKLGVDEEEIERLQDLINYREKDIKVQMDAWSDMGDVLRTESSLHPTRCPEPFLEDDYVAMDYDVWG